MTAMIFMYVDVMFLFCSHCVCVCLHSGWVVVGCVQSGMHGDCIHEGWFWSFNMLIGGCYVFQMS